MKINIGHRVKGRSAQAWQRLLMLACLSLVIGSAAAQENAIESVSAGQQGKSVVVKIAMKNPVDRPPIGFSITNPARIAVDFAGTVNATGKTMEEISLGDVRNVNIVQAGERSRLVFNLNRPMSYATAVDGKLVTVTIEGVADAPGPVAASPVSAAASAPASGNPPVAKTEKAALRDIDFRKGSAGEGRIVVELPNNQVGVDVRQEGKLILVDFVQTSLPEVLRRRMDVTDFGTPVATVATRQQGDNVRMTIEPQGLWEHSAYQSDTQLVIEVKPLREDPNKLVQGSRGYNGEKLSLNFQNVDVRSVLQVIADFTGLNIITSDSVSGNLTLRLKDVPWDQALDIVMRAKGLDMRKNGSVLWIAPKDELLTKEKLELEQKAQIIELEPLRTEVFQLNYLKAEEFRKIFGLGGAGAGAASSANANKILSRRGSVTAEPRSNKLFVTETATKIEEIRKLIQVADVSTRQVMIEARIVEADDTFNRELGARLGFFTSGGRYRAGSPLVTKEDDTEKWVVSPTERGWSVNLPATSATGINAGAFGLSLFNSRGTRLLDMELSALEADGKGKIISSPRVVTADQQAALIEQGEEIPYKKDTSSGATSIEFKKANLKLEVTPHITPDGNVILAVDINKDSRGILTEDGYAINTKHVKTNVQVENGGTVVIGGIFTQTEKEAADKVPFLGDIPVLGWLFKNTYRQNDKTELLIFLTPKIMNEKLTLR